jgi:hypothetical protein
MDDSKRHVIEFLEKEIKTYAALALFLTREEARQRVLLEGKKVVINPTFYRERMKEAKRLVNELKKPS